MPTPTFKRIDLTTFEQLLNQFDFDRKITEVHMHHTWRPRHQDFRGHETILSMWEYHTKINRWRDIAQHITLDPDGFIWLGRNWNLPPASASGYNGNSKFGPFMLQMIGDFDAGKDLFMGEQRETALKIVALVQKQFALRPETLRFHNMMSSKNCPGSALDYSEIVKEVAKIKKQLSETRAPTFDANDRKPFPDEKNLLVKEALEALKRQGSDILEPADAELDHHEHDDQLNSRLNPESSTRSADSSDFVERGSGLNADQLSQIRPHLINLDSGFFSKKGEVKTTTADVDAIFENYLEQAIQEAEGNKPLRLLFFAHGGLVSEGDGLLIAHKQIKWWMANGVYPLFFVWETGFLETLGELTGVRGLTRGFGEGIDKTIEWTARNGGGRKIWTAMKESAKRACNSASDNEEGNEGGGYYVAKKLQTFCAKHPGKVELHAVGHSAGSIFHSYFLKLTHALEIQGFKTVHFLAPAVTIDLFKRNLMPLLNKGIDTLIMYTMKRDIELDDNCAHVYHKSLLYLIYYALEPEPETPILGLEQSIGSDSALPTLFGLKGAKTAHKIIWSRSKGDTGKSASQSTSHGGFDDDPPTMNSVARWVLDKEDADKINEFPAARALATQSNRSAAPSLNSYQSSILPRTRSMAKFSRAAAPVISGRKRALCIGIDQYPNSQDRLSGCVNDAQNWGSMFEQLGFEVDYLLDNQATYAAIENALLSLMQSSRAGDSVAVQYSGHGSQVEDLNGDEVYDRSDDDSKDEALCPYDFANGAFFIDDDLAIIFSQLHQGVNLTLFMDCCHSGTNTRVAGIGNSGSIAPLNAKARWIRSTPELEAAHKRFRTGKRSLQSRAINTGGREHMRHIVFSACKDREVALEFNGNGYFTQIALQVLNRDISGLTNQEFINAFLGELQANIDQHPVMDCADAFASYPFMLSPNQTLAPGLGNKTIASSVNVNANINASQEAIHLLAQALTMLTASN